MIKKDESAFPIFLQEGLSHNCHIDSGLTKREYFAAMAMQGLLTKYNLKTPEDQQTIAQMSTELSDSLINELNKQSL